MELIKINDSKLKVILSGTDLEEFDLDTDTLDYGNTETKRMFWEILNHAKHAVGFDTDGVRVLVQLYPCRSGGCEMYITKIGAACADCAEEQEEPLLHYKPSHHPDGTGGRTGVFGFDTVEWLITVCRRLRGIGYGGDSAAYRGDDSRYYLFLDGLDATGYLPLDEYSFITEYGTAENVEALRSFLGEHGRAVCPRGAVEQLGIL